MNRNGWHTQSRGGSRCGVTADIKRLLGPPQGFCHSPAKMKEKCVVFRAEPDYMLAVVFCRATEGLGAPWTIILL